MSGSEANEESIDGARPSRLICVGDVHGCARELSRLVEALALTERDQLVFLGDYVDRGRGSRETVDLLLEIRRNLPRSVFLRGNHEDMLLDFLGLGGTRGAIFVRAGGAPTLESYGVDPLSRETLADEFRAALPKEHLSFFADSLALSYESGPWAFVHAGVRPGAPLAEQLVEDLLWIREDFLGSDHGLVQTVIYGHTPHRDVQFSSARRIGMDTGCVYGGRLSALDLTGGNLHQIARGSSVVIVRPMAAQVAATLAPDDEGPVRQAREALLRGASPQGPAAT